MPDTDNPAVQFLPAYADCIAQAANHWAWVELEVHWMLWALMEVHPTVGACLTSQVYTFTAKLDALMALMKLRSVPETFIKKVTKFAERSRSALDARNRFVHDVWLTDNWNSAAMGRTSMSARKVLDFKTQTVEINSLQADLGKIVSAQKEASALRSELMPMLPTLPKIPREASHPLKDIR
jgi:hypothetical protein